MSNFNAQATATSAYATQTNSIIQGYTGSTTFVLVNITNANVPVEIVPLRIRPVTGQVYPRFT